MVKPALTVVALILALAVPALGGELRQVATSESLAIGGPEGTFSMNECLTVADGADVVRDSCQASVMDGTGAYAGLHGNGRCSGVLDFFTGLATRICQLRLND